MRHLRSAVALCSCLALSALPGFAQDKVKLKNGSELSGRILAEDDTTLTLKTGRSELTLPKSVVSEISREQRPEELAPAPEPTVEEAVPEKAEWFAVRDEAGRVVGTFHRLERGELRDGRAAVRLEERFTFRREDGGHVNLHAIEWGTSELTPLAFHYREWEDEKGFVYQAEIANAHAQVTIVDREGVKRSERFPFPSGTLLPLLARRRLIQEGHTTARRITLPIFDPLQRKILARDHWVGELRQSSPGTQVRVYGVARHRDQLCEEWLDGNGKSVRLELNGPYLVAEPAKPEELQSWIEGGDSLPVMSAEVRGGRGLFRTFLPNPLWSVALAEPEAAQLLVRREEGDLSVLFLELEAGEAELTAEGALLELERRVRDLPAFERQGNLRSRRFGPLEGFELEFQYRVGEGIRGGRVGLVQRGEKRLGFVLSGPRRELERSAVEIERLLTRIELL
ncbi:MAG: hypothetical protein JNM84_13310 [Planctomycetes bacterium]|nr:hypothetical protein [Planctomycetota bacterium]